MRQETGDKRTLKLTIAYDGTRYAGWQIQASTQHTARGTQKPTLQGTLERVLTRILREPVRVVGSGRTDAGVHARAQVAHVRTRSTISRDRLLRSLNQLLPPDIAVTALQDVPATFHARFRAVRKRYGYRVFIGSVVPPFIRPYVHHVRAPLKVVTMRRELTALIGRHNFRAFARHGGAGRSTIRTLTTARLRREGRELHFEFAGNGFLHTMVRSMVGTVLEVGRGRLPAGTVRRMLRRGARHLAGTTAPAHGLTLMSVTYRRRDA